MIPPRLWTRFLEFPEWKLRYPDLELEEAFLLYKAELQLYKNYSDEIKNQTLNRQNNLANSILEVSNNISNILSPGATSGSSSQ